MTRWPSLLIVSGSAVLMQLHAFAFWTDHVGTVGVAWSLILEAIALWLWWQRRHTLAVVASALLIAGPFYQLSAPTLEALRAAKASARLLILEQAEVVQLEASVARYEANSADRLGWAERIDRAQAALTAARERVRARLAQHATSTDWRAFGVVALQALTLLVVMVTQVLAVAGLRGADTASPIPAITPAASTRQAMPARAATAPSKKVMPTATACPKHTTGAGPCYCPGTPYHAAATETLAEQVTAAIEADIETTGETAAALAKRLRVRPADVSMIRNHAERSAADKETVSSTVLSRLAAHYNIVQENGTP